MSKRKILTLAMTLAMVAILAIGGTMAYFTDTDGAKNTFTLGKVSIDLHEGAYKNVQKNGAPIKADGTLDTSKANPQANGKANDFGYDYLDETYQSWLAEQTLMPGAQGFNRIQKRIFVENTGNYDAYVRVIVGIPTGLDNADASKNILHFNQVTGEVNNNLGNWIEGGERAFTQDGYNYYIYYYNTKLPAGEATNAEALSYFWLDGKVDYDNKTGKYVYVNGTLTSIKDGKIEIPVYAEAIQADGFDTYTAAWAAYGDPAIKK